MTETVLTKETAPRLFAGLQVQRVSEVQHNTNLLIYGDYGVGKTVLSCSAAAVPAMNPVLMVDMEAGTLSVRNRYPDVDMVRVTSMVEFQQVYDALKKGDHGYRTIILDSLSEIQNFSMTDIMRGAAKEDRERDPDIPQWPEYHKNLVQIRRLVRAFRDLPVHTIMTALEDYDKDQQTGKKSYMPLLGGKAQKEIPAFFDIVVRMYLAPDPTEEGKELRLIQAKPTERVKAKDRSGLMPAVLGTMEPPSMSNIYEYALQHNWKEES